MDSISEFLAWGQATKTAQNMPESNSRWTDSIGWAVWRPVHEMPLSQWCTWKRCAHFVGVQKMSRILRRSVRIRRRHPHLVRTLPTEIDWNTRERKNLCIFLTMPTPMVTICKCLDVYIPKASTRVLRYRIQHANFKCGKTTTKRPDARLRL